VLFVLDVREGLTAIDRDIAELLRKSRTPVLVVANKADGRGREVLASEFYELGIGEPWVISALHGTGAATCWMRWWRDCRRQKPEVVDDKLAGRVAIYGATECREVVVGQCADRRCAQPGDRGAGNDTRPGRHDRDVSGQARVAGRHRRHPAARPDPGVEQYSLLRGCAPWSGPISGSLSSMRRRD